jgi:hypothetical protein
VDITTGGPAHCWEDSYGDAPAVEGLPVRLSRPTRGEQVILLAGVLLLLDAFLPWFRHCEDLSDLNPTNADPIYGVTCTGSSGWSNSLSSIGLLVALLMLLGVASRTTGVRIPKVGRVLIARPTLLAGGAVSLLMVFAQLITGDGRFGRSWGVFGGLVLAAGLAYGGYLRFREPPDQTVLGPARELGPWQQGRLDQRTHPVLDAEQDRRELDPDRRPRELRQGDDGGWGPPGPGERPGGDRPG